jgi:hypothetical protein
LKIENKKQTQIHNTNSIPVERVLQVESSLLLDALNGLPALPDQQLLTSEQKIKTKKRNRKKTMKNRLKDHTTCERFVTYSFWSMRSVPSTSSVHPVVSICTM